MGQFGLVLGAFLLVGAFALWRGRVRPDGALIARFTVLDRIVHIGLILSLAAMFVPGWHGGAGWVFVGLSLLVILRRGARRLLQRRYSRLRGSVARFGRWHRIGLLGLGLAMIGLAIPEWHGIAGNLLVSGLLIHIVLALRDRLALGAMANGLVRLDLARRRWPRWVEALFAQRRGGVVARLDRFVGKDRPTAPPLPPDHEGG